MKTLFKWVAIILGGFFIIGLIAGVSSGGKGGSNSAGAAKESAASSAKEIARVNAAQLFAAYENNEVATDESFKGKLIQVSGVVQAIDKDAFDNIVINFKTSNQFMPAHMKMEASEKAQAIALNKGAKATVLCEKMSRMIGSPYGSGCRFVAEEAPGGQKKAAG